jgi:hypothetical protein
MSFSPYNGNEKFVKFNKNFNKKEKFINDKKKNFFCDTPGFWQYDKRWDVVDYESNLIQPGVGTKQKTKMEMTEVLHPNNYNVPVSNVIQTENDDSIYFSAFNSGPGRGFGDMLVSNNIRVGDFTRTETRHFKAQKESQVLDRWQFIDDRFAKSDNLVMELPRGGDTTRKPQVDLTTISRLTEDKEFNFEY